MNCRPNEPVPVEVVVFTRSYDPTPPTDYDSVLAELLCDPFATTGEAEGMARALAGSGVLRTTPASGTDHPPEPPTTSSRPSATGS